MKMRDRPDDEQRVIEAEINRAVAEYAAEGVTHPGEFHTRIQSGAVERLCGIARRLGRSPIWIYWELSRNRLGVNVTLLHAIARSYGYKPGWVWFMQREIHTRIHAERDPREVGPKAGRVTAGLESGYGTETEDH